MNTSIENQLREQGFHVSTTVGHSMRPMLRDRCDRVIIKPLGTERLKKYDLPLYRLPDGRYVLHRVVGVRDDHYLIRGDNTYQLEKIPDAWILGVVTEFYRNDRHYSATDKRYRRYAALWNTIYPIRFAWVRFRTAASKIKHKILK
ncbi:MAG: hypothetical protein E7666_04755 [Ruminococcaceae bacterium]|nr:hypothetical protein [Oscillospiraceae bacterium]